MALRNERTLVAAALLLSLGVGLAVGYRSLRAGGGSDPTRDGARVRVAETGSLYRFVGTALTESQKKSDAPVPSLGLTASDGTGLTLASLDAKAVVQGPLAFTEMRLVFDNPEDRTLEGTFRITLPQGAAISRFAMRIGDKWQEGEVVEKQAARQAYEDFLHRRQDPALLEQAAGNEFSARVFPIPARGRKELIVSFSQEITPEMPYQLSLRGLPAVGKLDALVAGTGDDAPILGQIHLEKAAPDRDLVVEPARLPKGDGVKAGELALLRVRPAAEAGADAFGAGVVLVDTSASRALGFEAQITLLARTLGGLGNAKIVVAAFDQGIDVVYEGPAKDFESTGATKLRERQAFGASDLGSALGWAKERARSIGAKRLLLVTDGVATAGELEPQKLREAALALGSAGIERVDAIAVGGIRDDDGLAGLCAAGLARDGVVIDGTRGVDAAVRRLGAATRTVTVKVEGADWQYPEKLRGMQPGDEGLVYVKMLAGKTPKISFVEKSGTTAPTEPKLVEVDRPLLERAWVTAKIAQLVQQPTAGKSAYEIKQEIIALSTTHRVLSPHTALLVLETERDYARFKIDRKALADILTVDGTKLVRQKRSEDAAVFAPTDVQNVDKQQPVTRGGDDTRQPPRIGGEGFGKGGGGPQRDGASPRLGAAPGGGAPPPMEAPAPRREAARAQKVAATEAKTDSAPMAAASAAEPPPPPAATRAPDAEPMPTGGLAGNARGDEGRTKDADIPAYRAPAPKAPSKAKEKRISLDDDGPSRPTTTNRAPPPSDPKVAGPVALARPTSTPTPTLAPPSFRAANSDTPPTPPKDKFGPYEGPMASIMRALEAGDKASALEKALAFRAAAPGDVLAFLALGEVFEAMGELRSAARAYGSIIDLFPGRADLRRMAGERLERLRQDKARWAHALAADSYEKAVEQRPDHPSSHRLLAYARLRAGDPRGAFDAIEAGAMRTYPSNRFAGVDRILREDAGILGAAWIKADPSRREQVVDRLGSFSATLAEKPSLRFVLMWETDNNDVDFHIHDGKGGHAYYGAKELPSGGSLFADVTTGYGPECFAIAKDVVGRAAPYRLEAHYFSRGPMGYGMGKLEIIDHDGSGTLTFEERPYLIMSDRAYVQLGTYPGSQDDHGLEGTGHGTRPVGLPRPLGARRHARLNIVAKPIATRTNNTIDTIAMSAFVLRRAPSIAEQPSTAMAKMITVTGKTGNRSVLARRTGMGEDIERPPPFSPARLVPTRPLRDRLARRARRWTEAVQTDTIPAQLAAKRPPRRRVTSHLSLAHCRDRSPAFMANEQEELVTKIKSLLQKEYGDTTMVSTRKLFDKYDTNKDGKINDKELEVLLKDAGIGNALTRGAWIKGIIGALDKNGDKQIDWTEFEAAVGLGERSPFRPCGHRYGRAVQMRTAPPYPAATGTKNRPFSSSRSSGGGPRGPRCARAFSGPRPSRSLAGGAGGSA